MVSFIIPAYNEEELIGGTLAAVNAAGRALGRPYEIVVADDASTDRTAEIARAAGARVVSVERRQIAAVRNAGARAAAGSMFIFVDADTLVNEAVVAAAATAIEAGAAGGGSDVKFDGVLPLHGRIMAATFVPIYRWFGLAAGCFIFCSRAAFEGIGGFDEGLFAAEEAVFSLALHRQGKFVNLRESVTTSGRKLRTHSATEILGVLALLALRGPRLIRSRKGLDVWYGDRRRDSRSCHLP
jgi:glycosyltransferase involved in cell wall biosynthesis